MAPWERFAAATEHEALVGRLRKKVGLRPAPAPCRRGQRGRPLVQGPVLHPGAPHPQGHPDEDTSVTGEE
jgi:hypothetical protein